MSTALAAVLAGSAVAVLAGPGSSDVRLAALAGRAARAGPPQLPAPVLLAGLLGGAATAGLVVLGPAGALLLLAAAAAARRVVRGQRRAREGARERRQAVEACTALAAELRAGRPPSAALAVAAAVACGPSARVLAAAAAAAQWGGDVAAVLVEDEAAAAGLRAGPWAGPRASAVPELLRALAACWQVCAQAGSGLALAVERLADGLRAREVQERAVAAALAGPRASAVLLAGLPAAGLALAAGLGARPVHVLLHTPLGLCCAAGGVALDALGLWWTGRIVAAAAGVRP